MDYKERRILLVNMEEFVVMTHEEVGEILFTEPIAMIYVIKWSGLINMVTDCLNMNRVDYQEWVEEKCTEDERYRVWLGSVQGHTALNIDVLDKGSIEDASNTVNTIIRLHAPYALTLIQ